MVKTEAQTRSEIIDKLLEDSGWNVEDPMQVIEEFDILTALPYGVAEPRSRYDGHQFSDYVLLGKDGKPLAVIEAKKTSKDAAIGREQAKQYCFNIQKQLGCEVPFCFYTNGLDIFFWDLDNYPKDRRIYVSTYPSMLNIIRDESQQLSPHFFDFIVVDESHRSIYNTYKEVLDYFKTITLGLTATPTDIIDHNTFQLFRCEDGLPTFAYTFEEAINNVPPYLCSFQVMKIQTRFQMEGISKRTISLEDQKKLLLEGKEIEEINFEGSQLEKQVINKGTNALIVKKLPGNGQRRL